MGRKGKKKKRKNRSPFIFGSGFFEQGVGALAGQLGWFMGTVRQQADSFIENPMVRQQVSQIRDGALELFDRVNRAGTAAVREGSALPGDKTSTSKEPKVSTARPAKLRAERADTTPEPAPAPAAPARPAAKKRAAKPAAKKAAKRA
jgi:isopentenyl diphosphate isomerase/L-lactate dehydrogenase-like FMN-dependent dehydrogenase